jgi:hypothetical protein
LTTDEDPSIGLQWLDKDGAAIDLSAATWSVKLVNSAGTTTLTKTTNVTGYASLQGTTQQYNVLILWASGELAIAAGTYTLWVQATVSGRQRTFRPGDPPMVTIVTAPT